MKAIVHTGPSEVETKDRDRPSVGAGEVLVKVHTAGLCGSDAHAYTYDDGYQWIPIPRVMGHEYSGGVVRFEVEVTSFYGSVWRNFEQALRLMAGGDIDVETILDASYDVDDPGAAFDAFLDSATCKPVFQFSA